jgi:hypothetical protein
MVGRNSSSVHGQLQQQINNLLTIFSPAPFCPTMTPPPPQPQFGHAKSSRTTSITQEDTEHLTIETVEGTLKVIEGLDDWKREFFHKNKPKKDLEQILETLSNSSTLQHPKLSKAIKQYHKMEESPAQSTKQIEASFRELVKSTNHNIPKELQQETNALLAMAQMTSMEYSHNNPSYKSKKFNTGTPLKLLLPPPEDNHPKRNPAPPLQKQTRFIDLFMMERLPVVDPHHAQLGKHVLHRATEKSQ